MYRSYYFCVNIENKGQEKDNKIKIERVDVGFVDPLLPSFLFLLNSSNNTHVTIAIQFRVKGQPKRTRVERREMAGEC